jgi:hypothetical protein
MTPEIIADEPRFQCRHIFTDGRRCGSPALRGPEGPESFCYFHHNTRRPIQDAPARKRRRSRFTLPNPEDRSAIQHSIGEVLRRIASNEIDPRRGGILLYGLQIASLNLPKSTPREETAEPVSEVTHDPEHGIIAPRAELGHDRPKGSAQRLLEELEETGLNLQASAASPEPAPTQRSRPILHRMKILRKKVRGGVRHSSPQTPETIPRRNIDCKPVGDGVHPNRCAIPARR